MALTNFSNYSNGASGPGPRIPTQDDINRALYPNLSAVNTQASNDMNAAFAQGNYGQGVAHLIRGAAALIPAAGMDAAHALYSTATEGPVANFGSTVFTGAPLSSAQSAARAAAVKSASVSGGPDTSADVGSAGGPRTVPVGVVPSDMGNGITKYVGPNGATTYTNLGNRGYADLYNKNTTQLPSVPGFLAGVRDLYATGGRTTQGSVPAPRYTYSRGINGDLIAEPADNGAARGGSAGSSDRAAALQDQIAKLQARGDTRSLLLAAGLRKQLAVMPGLINAQAGQEYGEGHLGILAGQLGVSQGQLGVAQGTLGLNAQNANYTNTVHKSVIDMLQGDHPDVPGALQALRLLGGPNPDAVQQAPGLSGPVFYTPNGTGGVQTIQYDKKTGMPGLVDVPRLQSPVQR